MLPNGASAVRIVRLFRAISVLVGAAGLVVCACSQNPGSSEATSSGSGGAHCENIYTWNNDCGLCLQQVCCAELAACGAMDNCIACFVYEGNTPSICDQLSPRPPFTDALHALDTCYAYKCDPTCRMHVITGSTSSSSSSSSGSG